MAAPANRTLFRMDRVVAFQVGELLRQAVFLK
jgi:hypothetical protein